MDEVFSSSSCCAKMKVKYPGYVGHHLELLTSFAARVCTVVIVVWSCDIEVPQIRGLDQSAVKHDDIASNNLIKQVTGKIYTWT